MCYRHEQYRSKYRKNTVNIISDLADLDPELDGVVYVSGKGNYNIVINSCNPPETQDGLLNSLIEEIKDKTPIESWLIFR